MSIQIVAKKGSQSEVVDETDSRKQAKKQLTQWEKIKGKGWKVFTTVKK